MKNPFLSGIHVVVLSDKFVLSDFKGPLKEPFLDGGRPRLLFIHVSFPRGANGFEEGIRTSSFICPIKRSEM